MTDFFVACVDEGTTVQAFGPFPTRRDADADLAIDQANRLTSCHLTHVVADGDTLPADVPVYPARTTPLEREHHMARTAAKGKR